MLCLQDLRSITIVGPGLLGGSIALGLKSAGVGARILGIGHRKVSIDRALEIGAIDDGSLDVRDAAESEVVIIATPIGLFEPVLVELKNVLRPGAVITDVGSTKRYICDLAGRILPKGVHFVGSHPMAGSEKRGIDFARADLCLNATCIVTPSRSNPKWAVGLVGQLWSALGMRLVQLTPLRHDRILARISHLPHVVASALVNASTAEELKLTGGGFMDATRIASGDVNLWHDIIASNPDCLLEATAALRKQLDKLDAAVKSGDSARIKRFLDAAKEKRDWLVKFKYDTSRFEA